jgi:hypothetical protein
VISKLVRTEDANQEYNRYTNIKAVDPKHLFSIELVSRCAPGELDATENSVDDCGIVLDKGNLRDYQLLQYRDGGGSLEQAFEVIRTDEQALKFLGAVYRFIWGLYKLSDDGVGHFDIKPDNITYNGSHMYLIDYGSVTRFDTILDTIQSMGPTTTYLQRNQELLRRTGLDFYTPYDTWPLEFPVLVFGPQDLQSLERLPQEKQRRLFFPESAASIERDALLEPIYRYSKRKAEVQTYLSERLDALAEASNDARDFYLRILLTADMYAFGILYFNLSQKPGVHRLLREAFSNGIHRFISPSAFDRYNEPNILDEFGKWCGSRGVSVPDMEREEKAPVVPSIPVEPFVSTRFIRAIGPPPIETPP